jgi:hypothetical protein
METITDTALESVAKAMYETCGFDLYGRDLGSWDGPDYGPAVQPDNRHFVEPEKDRWRGRAQVVLHALRDATEPAYDEADLVSDTGAS